MRRFDNNSSILLQLFSYLESISYYTGRSKTAEHAIRKYLIGSPYGPYVFLHFRIIGQYPVIQGNWNELLCLLNLSMPSWKGPEGKPKFKFLKFVFLNNWRLFGLILLKLKRKIFISLCLQKVSSRGRGILNVWSFVSHGSCHGTIFLHTNVVRSVWKATLPCIHRTFILFHQKLNLQNNYIPIVSSSSEALLSYSYVKMLLLDLFISILF